ncbi:gamma-butyrobetaine hydroxylase-like domain-containing protein [Xanthobacteraceae bacterium A53D]
MTTEPASDAAHWPRELRLSPDKSTLTITFDDGASFSLAAEFLRVESPSAEVQGHAPHEKVTVPGKRRVKITELHPVGSYAIRPIFDDGHSTGIYAWPVLRTMGEEQETRFGAYLEALKEKGLSRD